MLRLVALFSCVIILAGSAPAQDASKPAANELKPYQGLWSGSWGGGDRGGVVFQPVKAEMVITGDRIEGLGFRNPGQFRGSVRIDRSAKKLTISLSPADDKKQIDIEFTYELNGDKLTLTDAEKIPINLTQHPIALNPLANVAVELVAAEEITEAGDLRVTEIRALDVVRSDARYYHAESRLLKTGQATVLQTQESGVKKTTLKEARAILRKGTPVVISYRPTSIPIPFQAHDLWKDTGPVAADDAATWETYSRSLRPGTLIFVLSSLENQPVP